MRDMPCAKTDEAGVVFGALVFRGRDEAFDYFRRVLRDQPEGVNFEPGIARALHGLVDAHPDADEKTGCGISSFFVQRIRGNQPELRFERSDGSIDNISVRKCVYGAPNPRKALMRALRAEVQEDIRDVRRKWFRTHGCGSDPQRAKCAITGDGLMMADGHMDHVPPMTFHVIATTFLLHKGFEVEDIGLEGRCLGGSTLLADRDLAADWQIWHAKLARLRFIGNDSNHLDRSLQRIEKTGFSIDGPEA